MGRLGVGAEAVETSGETEAQRKNDLPEAIRQRQELSPDTPSLAPSLPERGALSRCTISQRNALCCSFVPGCDDGPVRTQQKTEGMWDPKPLPSVPWASSQILGSFLP